MSFFSKHKALIHEAAEAIHRREHYTPYPEHHKAYPEEGADLGKLAFEQMLNKPSKLDVMSGGEQMIGEEVSPYTGKPLGVTYAASTAQCYIDNAQLARKPWKQLGVDERMGLLAEALDRIQHKYFELAYATMHTSGQSFMMAFQASGPHSSDRALEAAVLAWHEIKRFPADAVWEKPMGRASVTLNKTYSAVPKGIGLVIGCSTFPVWNTVPGVFANLAAGNPVIVKPHPSSVLPIAIVIAELRALLAEAGLPEDIVQLAVDTSSAPITKTLAEHPAVKLIDYTGGTAFGNYVESLTGKTVFTEKAGVNCVIVDSVDNLDAVLDNLAFSVSLYSGQMCTAPQNFFIPEEGVKEGDKLIPFDQVAARFKAAVDTLVENPKVGPGTMATIQSEQTLQRIKQVEELDAEILRAPEAFSQPGFAEARCSTPAMLVVDAAQGELYRKELFGPIIFLVKTKNTAQSVELAADVSACEGALTCSAYTTGANTEALIREEMEAAFTSVSFNLTGFIWVNQAAGFSDFHVSGGNPAGNATFANPEYVNKRFVWVQHRKLAAT